MEAEGSEAGEEIRASCFKDAVKWSTTGSVQSKASGIRDDVMHAGCLRNVKQVINLKATNKK